MDQQQRRTIEQRQLYLEYDFEIRIPKVGEQFVCDACGRVHTRSSRLRDEAYSGREVCLVPKLGQRLQNLWDKKGMEVARGYDRDTDESYFYLNRFVDESDFTGWLHADDEFETIEEALASVGE